MSNESRWPDRLENAARLAARRKCLATGNRGDRAIDSGGARPRRPSAVVAEAAGRPELASEWPGRKPSPVSGSCPRREPGLSINHRLPKPALQRERRSVFASVVPPLTFRRALADCARSATAEHLVARSGSQPASRVPQTRRKHPRFARQHRIAARGKQLRQRCSPAGASFFRRRHCYLSPGFWAKFTIPARSPLLPAATMGGLNYLNCSLTGRPVLALRRFSS